ncbi:MAG TPA: penicillin-binding protein 2 [Acidimicrobiales bacterium]|jgi:cell division protein FtsI (penicillin-binding protein 3)|nr:penicillin-binding protein 2 [Acidimicrobiales bacterium]
MAPRSRTRRPQPQVRRRTPDVRRRLVALLAVLGVLFTVVVGRLVMIQGVSPDKYVAVGESQRLRDVVLPAGRGAMFDRNGRDLALTIPQKTVWANPHLVTDPLAAAKALSPVLHVDEAVLGDRLSRDAGFVYLARKVDDKVVAQVEKLHLSGVFFLDEPKRFNPAGDLAGPLLGVVGTDNEGLSGLELQFEKKLKGTPGELRVERDPYGNEIASGDRSFTPAQPGDDLVLTIDRSLQYETEKALSEEIVKSNSKGGTAIVMDPKTGEILSMANLTYDGADSGKAPYPSINNTAVTSVYEPGSVNKVITIAAALEEGLVAPDTTLAVPDHLRVADHVFSDHDPHPLKQWTVTDIMATSSNIGTIMIGKQLGKTRLDAYLRKFGLGSKTGLGFPGEPRGLLLDPKKWSGTSIGTVPIGQGLAVTALQMLDAYNTVANGGVLVTPKLVKATVDGEGTQAPTPASPRRRVVSEKTADQVKHMLTEVVKVGTGTEAAIDGYTVAGKTGTARKPYKGGYKQGAYLATFAGFVPAENPRLSAIVVLDEPAQMYGGLVSAPVFAKVAQYGLRLFRIPPPRPQSTPADTKITDPDAAKTADVAPPSTASTATTARPTTTSTPPR